MVPRHRVQTRRALRAPFGAGLLLAFLSFLSAPGPAAGQTPQPPAEAGEAPAEAEAAPEAPKALTLPEVAAAIDETEQRLRDMERLARRVAAVRAIETELPERTQTIEEGLARTEELLEGELDFERLRDFEAAWVSTRSDLTAWRETLTQRATELEGWVSELDEMRARWEETSKRARAQDAPATLLSRIEAMLESVVETGTEIGARRAEVLTLQNRVAEEEDHVADIVNELRLEVERRRGQLLRRDAPPLWGLFPFEPGALVPSPDFEPRDEVRRSVRFFQERSDGVVGHALFLVVVLALLLRLQRRARHWSEDDPRRASAVVWERPISTTLLLAVLSAAWFYTYLPEGLRHMLGLAVVVALLRLVPVLMPDAVRPGVYGLTAFYVVDRLRDLLSGAPVGERLVFLLEIAVAAGLLLALLRPGRLAKLPRGVELPSGLSPIMRVAAAMLVTSVAANVFGFVGLARLLGESVLRAAYLAVLLYAGLRVVRTLIRVALQSQAASRLHMVRRHRALLMGRIDRVLALAFGLAWVLVVLDLFTLLQPAIEAGRGVLEASISFGTITLSLGEVVGFAITVTAAIWLARSLTFVLEEDVFPRVTMQRGIPGAISATARYAILFGGFVLAVAAAGVDFERFTILAGALGVGIGFGLQNVVNNFVSGLILLYERPIQVGDAIQMQDLFGEVRRIGIRSSTVRTWEGAEVIVPNADLISSAVTNWTLSDRHRRMTVKVGVAYGTDPERVLEILSRVAREHPDVLDEPAPFARFVGFGDSSLDFELWAFSPRFEVFWRTVNDVVLTIHKALREAGIEIPFPQRDLHLRSAAPEAARLLRGADVAPRSGDAGGEARVPPAPDARPPESPAPDTPAKENLP